MQKYLDKISTSKQKETAQQKPKRKYKDVQIIFLKATFLLLLVCRKRFIIFLVCHEVEKFGNHWSRLDVLGTRSELA